MSELSKYIHKELSTILNQIEQTPPRKSASMHKIKTLLNQAPLTTHEKTSIHKSIRKIESAMPAFSKNNKTVHGDMKSSKYSKNLFYENLLLEERSMNLDRKMKTNSKMEKNESKEVYSDLLDRLQELRLVRMKKDEKLNSLILKTQRMERLLNLRQENTKSLYQNKLVKQEQNAFTNAPENFREKKIWSAFK